MKQAQRDPGDNQIEFPGTPEQEEPRREPGVERIPDNDRDEDDVGIDPDLGDLDNGKAPAREQR
ncbi:MAG TPA: hypothetical protein VK019_05295 [Pseudomonas sp.]|nr:hypothetical protein [Pseudomonas sp.]